MLSICLHIANIYSIRLSYTIAVLQKGSICRRPRKRKVLRVNVFSAWHTEWNSSSDKLVDVAGIGVFTNVIKAFKEIGKQKLSDAIEYRNTTRICLDCLQSSLKKGISLPFSGNLTFYVFKIR